ncbi:hypothetical protein [Chryseobacterium soldanellicola]|nr:hypothetical protein [Chryseobacterium soldanellicola]
MTIDHFDDYGKIEIKANGLIGNEYDGSEIEFIDKDVHPFSR